MRDSQGRVICGRISTEFAERKVQGGRGWERRVCLCLLSQEGGY